MNGLFTQVRKTQAGRFICLLVMIIFGCCTITVTGLFVRSIKQTELNDSLDITGDYDVIVFNTDPLLYDILHENESINNIGCYYELGTVTDEQETASFKAVAFRDDVSEELYHQTCIRGSYPSNANEIAIDVSVANRYGIPSMPGEIICLNLYDEDGIFLESRDYVVSGIFRGSCSDAYGGWYRYSEVPDGSEYSLPAVIFYPDADLLSTCPDITLFVSSYSMSGSGLSAMIDLLMHSNNISKGVVSLNTRIISGYTWYIGVDNNSFQNEYGNAYTRENITKAVEAGYYKRDIFSSTIFPVISGLVIITEIVSLYTLSVNILEDRKDYYGILRSVGMSSRQIIKDIIKEMASFAAIGATVGCGLGTLLHIIILNGLNRYLYLRLSNGLTVEKSIKIVTYDPVLMSIVVCILSFALALVIPLYRLYKLYPSELLASSNDLFVRTKKIRKRKKTNIHNGWLGLLNRRIELHDSVTMFVLAVVLSTMLLGYVYFRAYSDAQTSAEQFFAESLGVGDYGYTVTLPSEVTERMYNIYNRHDAGIIPSFPEEIENDPCVDNVCAVIMNRSTRMVFSEEPDDDMIRLLGNRMLNLRPTSYLGSAAMLEAEQEAEGVIFEHMGYDPHTIMYELPTVGLTVNEMASLEQEIVAGTIDIDKIRTGQEVVLAVPPELVDICISRFPVGSSLALDDILLSEEEEQTNGSIDDINPEWICYEREIPMADGSIGTMMRASIGHRYTFETTVGAIVILRDINEQDLYLTHDINGVTYLTDEETGEDILSYIYGMSVLCLPESFETWGLPDRNYTSVKARLNEDADIYEFESFWYIALKGSVDVETASTFEYSDTIKVTSTRTMIIFYFLMVSLTLLGMVSVITGLYTKTRNNTGRFQTLRRIGLSVNQASLMIYTQNMFYPLLASLIAMIPVYFLQLVFNDLSEKIRNGEILTGGEGWNGRQWYDQIPWWKNLFSYNFVPALICCFLIGVLLIVAGTLPQILYLRKMKMIETREE